jgi:NAD dependent epimerase/dehydratase family enzyme
LRFNFSSRLGLGGKIGSGKQYMPCIHQSDAVGIFQFALENPQVHGVLNAVLPQVTTNENFTAALGKAVNRKTIFTIPEWAAKIIFSGRSELVLEGQKVIPKRTLELGYKFHFQDLESAMKDAVMQSK